jgi:hypothetical protein
MVPSLLALQSVFFAPSSASIDPAVTISVVTANAFSKGFQKKMTHPLQKHIKSGRLRARRLGRPYAAIMVERKGNTLRIIPDQLHILKHDIYVVELPEDITVLPPLGNEPVQSSSRFWITTETFDPYHAVLDWDGVHKEIPHERKINNEGQGDLQGRGVHLSDDQL